MYLTETSAPTRGRPTETYLETVLLHKSPLVSGCTVTACVSWKRTVNGKDSLTREDGRLLENGKKMASARYPSRV
jgi:hypothetical protein